LHAILHEEPKPVRNLLKNIPFRFEDILSNCLQKNPLSRYQDMESMISDLRTVDLEETKVSRADVGPEEPPSIAVLPFVNMSADPENEYFSDGLSETIINTLTKIKDFKVVARTSAFSFKGKEIDIRHIGQQLGVNKVLEGSVQKAGNRLRITAQLINVADGYHLWSEKFDREMEDVFAIQDEISLAIVDHLKISLLKKEEEALLKRYTDDPEAYNLYLKGLYFLRMYTAKGFQEAVKYFEKTLKKDPTYALAYYGLAEVFYAISYWANVPPNEAYPKAKEYAKKALEIDENIGEAHAALGLVYTFYEWNWAKAEHELTKALELNPSSAIIHMSYSWFLSLTEKHEEAIAEAKQAQNLDPFSPLIISHIGLACIYGGQLDKAIEELKSGICLIPNFYLMHYYLGLAYRAKSMFKKAIVKCEKAVELSGGAPWPALILNTIYFETGQTNKGKKLLQSLRQRAHQAYMPPLGFTYIYLVQKDMDQAYKWLERAFKERDSFLPWCAIIPIKEYQIAEKPRLRTLFKKYGLVK
ncbi:MAG: tetratricopeptide repeat protein, partial [Candidatus Aminicenantales bacterium]